MNIHVILLMFFVWIMKIMYLWRVYFFQDDLGSLKDIENNVAIFCMATYGEGDATDNTQELFDLINRDELELSGVNYAVSRLCSWC